jgi:cold shock CspA family protein
MPYGEVTEFDTAKGVGRIDTDTGWYEVHVEDMDAAARTKHAKVDFDVQREDPQDRAVNVRLRGGTRNNPNQRRFGDDG